MMEKFPFADDLRTACFTCFHVLEEDKPILYFSHDEDGYWQFYVEKNIIKKKQELFL